MEEPKPLYEGEHSYINPNPVDPIRTIDDLRAIMAEHRADGALFLDYLLEGYFFEGKGVWTTPSAEVRNLYEVIMRHNSQLSSENPFSPFFNREKVRVAGENDVLLSLINDAPQKYREQVTDHQLSAARGAPAKIMFGGGPAPKIAAVIAQLSAQSRNQSVVFVFEGAEQSNESASAHYEHINHANALNAEHDNGGMAILMLALRRAIWGEPDPSVALHPDYHKVDLWPSGIKRRDAPLLLYNEIHGKVQRIRASLGLMNDHDKSRFASKISTRILSYLQLSAGLSVRLPNDGNRALFVYISEVEHKNSYREFKRLSRCPEIYPRKASEELIRNIYGHRTLEHIISADVFPENHCIRHGFDKIALEKLEELGGSVKDRMSFRELYFRDTSEGSSRRSVFCCGVRLRDEVTRQQIFFPVDALGLSLGPTARYRFSGSGGLLTTILDAMSLRQPVPHQTIATGFAGQLLFRIRDRARFYMMAHTGLKQTHFVEVGRYDDLLVLKLTSGGNIGLPVYSRSYALGALASLFRILPPGCGLDFLGVVCAWPGTRGVNGPNNGQVVRLADNLAVRFGEGGTGMSKMATNAQTILDLIGVAPDLPEDLLMDYGLYQHTVLDRRGLVAKRLSSRRH